MEVECTTELKKFQRRQFYRLPCTIEGYFRKLTDTELLRFQHDNIVPEDTQDVDKGIIVDISGGGLRIMTEKPLEKNNYIYFEVKDTGMGINKKDIDNIWDKYYKVEIKHKRNIVSTGLGLSIVRNVLDKHKLKYGVISKSRKGTTFYVVFTKNKK